MTRVAVRQTEWSVAIGLVIGVILTTAGTVFGQPPGTVVARDARVQGRSYVFAETGETIQYALFVPTGYDPARKWPLIVGLHGAGRPYDWLMGYDGMIDFAQQGGYILVTPLGYHPLGGYGVPRRTQGQAANLPPAPAATPELERLRRDAQALPPEVSERSENDVMNVFNIVRNEFNVDPNRIYLWGHSMGGGGTYHLAAKYPDIWAALAVAAPAPPADLGVFQKFARLPILVLQGDADRTVLPDRTRESVARMKQLGMEYVYVEIKGGDHSLFVSKSPDTLSKVFSFFNIVRKDQRPAVAARDGESAQGR